TQAEIFALLTGNPAAMEALSSLRHSFVTLCLDLESRPSSPAAAAALAHSGNFSNRWYSSALQIVVFGNSKACLIFNFNACLAGNVQMRAASEIWKRSVGAAGEAGSDADGEVFASREIVIPVKRELLDKVQKDVTSVFHDDPATFEIPEFGTPFFLSRGVSPVPAFVAALQLALFRITGRAPRIGQLLTMSRYRCMDLTTAFVTTPEMVNFVHSMANSSGDKQQLRDLLRAAVDSHIAACREARQCFPLFRLHSMMADRAQGIRRFYLKSIIRGTNLLLRMLKLDRGPADILISHPQVYDEVHVVGRPGVRVPYLKCFGLHYQIRERSIVLTWMPAMDWQISNAEMTKEVVRALQDIAQLANPETPLDGTKGDLSLE
ncbi:MAG: choline/carnitine O-acyltransferase, partial [Candidatus Eremiobacteraeota bacterium]|nr:choline/carnitine O-acyltransferase [Candidatus Eremiobacteraeota bacterium]